MRKAVTQESFASEVLHAPGPVLVDFWAAWCTPCEMISPILDEIASEYAGRVTVVGVDVDAYEGLANSYEVVSIPSLVLFHAGKEIARHVGAAPKEHIAAFLEEGISP